MKRSAWSSSLLAIAAACLSPACTDDSPGGTNTTSTDSGDGDGDPGDGDGDSGDGDGDSGDGDGDPGGGGEHWTEPTQIDQNTDLAQGDTLAVDAEGNLIALWMAKDDGPSNPLCSSTCWSLWSNRYDASSGEWGGPELIESDDAGEASQLPHLIVDPEGNAFAVWTRSSQDPGTPNPAAWFNRYDRASGQWGAAGPTHPGQDNFDTWPHLVPSPSGPPVLIWSRGTLEGDRVWWSSTFNESMGQWQGGVAISSEPGAVHQPSSVQLAGGDGLLVWQQRGVAVDEGTVRSARLDHGSGQWVDAVELEPTFLVNINLFVTAPRVAAVANGDAIAIWHADLGDGARIRSAHFDGDAMTWGVVSTLDLGTVAAFNPPSVAVSEDGEALAVWSDENHDLSWARFDPGLGAWLPPVMEGPGSGPEVAINDRGVAVITWATKRDDGGWDAWARSVSLEEGVWGTPHLFESNQWEVWTPLLVTHGSSFWAIWKDRQLVPYHIWISHSP